MENANWDSCIHTFFLCDVNFFFCGMKTHYNKIPIQEHRTRTTIVKVSVSATLLNIEDNQKHHHHNNENISVWREMHLVLNIYSIKKYCILEKRSLKIRKFPYWLWLTYSRHTLRLFLLHLVSYFHFYIVKFHALQHKINVTEKILCHIKSSPCMGEGTG